MRHILAIFAVVLIAACAGSVPTAPVTIVETQDVFVEVPVRREPPAELQQPLPKSEIPTFVTPEDPSATSALTAEGVRNLKLLLFDYKTRVSAWEFWGTAP